MQRSKALRDLGGARAPVMASKPQGYQISPEFWFMQARDAARSLASSMISCLAYAAESIEALCNLILLNPLYLLTTTYPAKDGLLFWFLSLFKWRY